MMDKASFIAKTSFFDDVVEKESITGLPKLWLTTKEYESEAKQLAFRSDSVICSGYLSKKSQKIPDFKNHYYALYDDRLVRFKVFRAFA